MVRISNQKLLEILEKNSRIPFLRLAKMFGVSETAIRKRVKTLERDGIIKRYTIEMDLKKLGLREAWIGIDTKPERYIEVIENIKRINDIKEFYLSTGDHMLMLKIIFRESHEIEDLIKRIEKIPGVVRVCPAIFIERIK